MSPSSKRQPEADDFLLFTLAANVILIRSSERIKATAFLRRFMAFGCSFNKKTLKSHFASHLLIHVNGNRAVYEDGKGR